MKNWLKITVLLPMLIVLLVLSVSAVSDRIGLIIDTNGVMKEGRTFTVTVSVKEPVSALSLSVLYDEYAAELKSVTATASHTLRSSDQNGCISVIFSDAAARSGSLFTLTFKALRTARTDIVFSPVSAVNKDGALSDLSEDDSLTLYIDESASSVSASSRKGDTASSKIKTTSASVQNAQSSPDENPDISYFDLTKPPQSPTLRVILIAAGVIVTIFLSVTVGVILGRRSKQTSKQHTKDEKTEQ